MPLLKQDYPHDTPHHSEADGLARWLQTAEARTQAKLRMPVIMATQRIGLASRRCGELAAEARHTRHRLLNLPTRADPGVASRLEDRAIALEREAHAERVSLWRDLQPLAESARDAAVDRIRQSWLSELERVIGESSARGGLQ